MAGKYTYESAAYANSESTAAVAVTTEVGSVVVSEADDPDEWARMLTQVTPAPFALSDETIKALVDAQCRERIDRAANLSGQHNAHGRRGAGKLPPADHATHDALLDWVLDMQDAARALIAAKDETFADDRHWPAVPDGVPEMVSRY